MLLSKENEPLAVFPANTASFGSASTVKSMVTSSVMQNLSSQARDVR